MADVDYSEQEPVAEDAEQAEQEEPLPDDASLAAVLESSPAEKHAWVATHPEQWAALKEEVRPRVTVAHDKKLLEQFTAQAMETPVDRAGTLKQAFEYLDAAHERDATLQLEPELMATMEALVDRLNSLPSTPIDGPEPQDLLQRGAREEARRALAELAAAVAVIDTQRLSMSQPRPTGLGLRQKWDRWGNLVTTQGGVEVERYTPQELAEINARRAEEAASGEEFTETGRVTLDELREWPLDKRLRFRQEFPDEWESFRLGAPSISGVKKRKETS